MEFIKRNAGIFAVIAIVIAITSLLFPRQVKTIVEKVTPESFVRGVTNFDSLQLGDTQEQLTFGPTSSNSITLSVERQSMTSGTTTPCAILSPAATTTLESFTMSLSTGTSTAPTITLATSTTAYATTSVIVTQAIGAGRPFSWASGVNNSLISPSTYVVLGAAGIGGTGGFVWAGTCTAKFLETQ